MKSSYILLDDQVTESVRYYENPLKVIQADDARDVEQAFQDIQTALDQGFHVAGYASYELGYALEPKLSGLMPKDRVVPLLQFGVFEHYEARLFEDQPSKHLGAISNLTPVWDFESYSEKFNRVIAYIEAGDVYQINLTFPIHGTYDGDGRELYELLRLRQPGRYGGVVSLEGSEIISLSPELFFKTNGPRIDMRPMKGTARRQADPAQDAALRDAMQIDLKSRAENLMIVDLLRNDVSRIAEPGSVKVPELFSLETYPTLHQMTSLVTAKMRHDISIRDIFCGLYPCGSITGAPKIRAMEIIRELETQPRGAYCGAMGYIDPDGESCFNVAIRTLTLEEGHVTYNVGGGVVLDSRAEDEYDEALLKAKVLAAFKPDLIETLRWVPGVGGIRAARHLARMARSAEALGYVFSPAAFENHLASINENSAQRVRLALSSEGNLTLETSNFKPIAEKWAVSFSKTPLTTAVQETRFKVSERRFYDSERRRVNAITGCDEVLFFNAEGYVCEGSFTSLFVEKDGQLLTPPVSCGLLPGILREDMIEIGQVSKKMLTLSDIIDADRLFVGNSLRGLIEVSLTDEKRH